MNKYRNNEKHILHSQFFVLGIVAALLLYGCGESDTGSDQQSRETTTGNATPEPAKPDTTMVAEAPAMPEPEKPDTATVTEAPAMPEPAKPDTVMVSEAPATAAMEEQVATVTESAPEAPKLSGRDIYNTYCAICHKLGLNAAPKYGAKPYWKKRIEQGRDVMYKHAIEGLRGMPPRGGFPILSDRDIKEGVDYMVKGSGGWGDS